MKSSKPHRTRTSKGDLPDGDPTAAHLLSLTHNIFATINYRHELPPSYQQNLDPEGLVDDKDECHPCMRSHLAKEMSVEHADIPVYDSSNLLLHFKGLVKAHPNVSVEVLNSSVWFYDGYASVWCWLEVSGLSGQAAGECSEGLRSQRREAVAVLFWEKVKDEEGGDAEAMWVCTRHKGLRGVLGT